MRLLRDLLGDFRNPIEKGGAPLPDAPPWEDARQKYETLLQMVITIGKAGWLETAVYDTEKDILTLKGNYIANEYELPGKEGKKVDYIQGLAGDETEIKYRVSWEDSPRPADTASRKEGLIRLLSQILLEAQEIIARNVTDETLLGFIKALDAEFKRWQESRTKKQ